MRKEVKILFKTISKPEIVKKTLSYLFLFIGTVIATMACDGYVSQPWILVWFVFSVISGVCWLFFAGLYDGNRPIACFRKDALGNVLYDGDIVYHKNTNNLYSLYYKDNDEIWGLKILKQFDSRAKRVPNLSITHLSTSVKVGNKYDKDKFINKAWSDITIPIIPIRNKKSNVMEFGKFNIDEVIDFFNKRKPGDKFHGYTIAPTRKKLKIFMTKGVECVACGLTGVYFTLQKDTNLNSDKYHFELYGYNASGSEVMLSRDHIIPTFHGGPDTLENSQPMCVDCNMAKGHNYVPDIIEKTDYTIEEVYERLDKASPTSKIFDVSISTPSIKRLKRFRKNGAVCVDCGLAATHVSMVYHNKQKPVACIFGVVDNKNIRLTEYINKRDLTNNKFDISNIILCEICNGKRRIETDTITEETSATSEISVVV